MDFLADTSVWIDYFLGTNTEEAEYLYQEIIKDSVIFICPTIIQEILQGFKEDKDYELCKQSLLAFPILNLEPINMAIKAADLYRTLRKKGATIRKSNDCLIATIAMEANVPILHKDRDFNIIANHSELEIVTI